MSEQSLGQRVRRLRTNSGLSQAALAEAVQVTPGYISKVERDRQPPSAWLLRQIAAVTGASTREWEQLASRLNRPVQAGAPPTRQQLRRRLPLPPQSRRPVGRGDVIERIRSYFASGADLVTIVGEPGIGKTTVAIEVAQLERNEKRRPVVWADAREREASSWGELENYLVRYVLGPSATTDPELDRKGIIETLVKTGALVVIDNLESAVGQDTVLKFVAELSKPASALVTSREWTPSNIGAVNHRLSELPHEEAATLFRQVGQRAGQTFCSRDDEEIIKAISVDILEGHPGAIEIAAALWSAWPLVEILRGLRNRQTMQTLTDPQRRDVNRSMRVSIDLSYEVLEQTDQMAHTLLPRLAVFPGSYTHYAAADVCGLPAALQPLASLVHHSLVRFERGRYRLHSVVRHYAEDRLGQEAEHFQARFSEYFYHYAADHHDTLDELEEEANNLLAALEWYETRPERGSMAVALAQSLAVFLGKRGYWRERVRHLTRALEIASLASDAFEVAKIAIQLGQSSLGRGDVDQAVDWYKRARRAAQSDSGGPLEPTASFFLAQAEFARGNLEDAWSLAQVTACSRDDGELRVLSRCLIAKILDGAGQTGPAKAELETALEDACITENSRLQTVVLRELYRVDAASDRPDEAEHWLRELIRVASASEDTANEGDASISLGELLLVRHTHAVSVEGLEMVRRGVELLKDRPTPDLTIKANQGRRTLAFFENRVEDGLEAAIEIGTLWQKLLGDSKHAVKAWLEAAELAEQYESLDWARKAYELVLSLWEDEGRSEQDDAVRAVRARLQDVRRRRGDV